MNLTSNRPGREILQSTCNGAMGKLPLLFHGKSIRDHDGEDNVGAVQR